METTEEFCARILREDKQREDAKKAQAEKNLAAIDESFRPYREEQARKKKERDDAYRQEQEELKARERTKVEGTIRSDYFAANPGASDEDFERLKQPLFDRYALRQMDALAEKQISDRRKMADFYSRLPGDANHETESTN